MRAHKLRQGDKREVIDELRQEIVTLQSKNAELDYKVLHLIVQLLNSQK